MILVQPTAKRPWSAWSAIRDGAFVNFAAAFVVGASFSGLPTTYFYTLFPGLLPPEVVWARYAFAWAAYPVLLVFILGGWAFGRGVSDKVFAYSKPIGPTLNMACVTILALVAILTIDLGLALAWPEQTKADLEIVAYLLSSPMGWMMTIVAVIVAPFSEEVFWRGFLFSVVAQSRLGVVGSALATSAFWAASHYYSPPSTAAVFLSGLIFCALFNYTRSLWPATIIHAAINAISTAVILFFPDITL